MIMTIDMDSRLGGNKVCMFTCPGHAMDELQDAAGPIPHYYSCRHANDAGWVFTKDIAFCKPDNLRGVWMCPACAVKHKFERVKL